MAFQTTEIHKIIIVIMKSTLLMNMKENTIIGMAMGVQGIEINLENEKITTSI